VRAGKSGSWPGLCLCVNRFERRVAAEATAELLGCRAAGLVHLCVNITSRVPIP
jgi:hypothetical protein